MSSLLTMMKRFLTDPLIRDSYLARMGAYRFVSDETFLRRRFRLKMGRELNLENPRSFNEKLQWLKLHDRKPEYTMMVDKFSAKEYVAEIIGRDSIVPTLGVWDRFEDIDFDTLPDQFVLKCTHDSGGLVICRDKKKLDFEKAKKKIQKSLKTNYYYVGREWPYKNVKPRILAEVYMEDEGGSKGLTDYKFFCFHGEPKLLYVSQGLEDHSTARISFYDLQGKEMPFHRSDFYPMDTSFQTPAHFDKMVEIAGKLAKEVGSPFVRIDLYLIKDKVYFSEITFTPCGGMLPFEPQEWDEKLGEWINLKE